MQTAQTQTSASVAPDSAFSNLQSAILRLAAKPNSGQANRHELNDLVGQALEAYREYMKAVGSSKPA